jgi:hypothetical protein
MKTELIALVLALGCVFILTKEPQAESLPIRIIASETTTGFNCYDSHEYYKMSAYIIELQTGIRIRPKFVCRLLNSFNISLFERYKTFASFNKELRKRILPTKIITGGVTDGTGIFTGGLAFIGLERGLGWSHVVPKNQNNEDRRYWAVVTIAHELGHMLGAEHDESEGSIMSSVSLGRLKENPNQTLAFTDKSIRQIRRGVRFSHRKTKRNSSNVCVIAESET